MNSIIPRHKISALVAITRLNKPIGIFLLMWPMLWAFWFAAEGVPHLPTLLLFLAGTVLTRSAGCAINDYADRDFDAHVARTSNRPLATGALSGTEALLTTAVLMGLAFILVLQTNSLTIKLSVGALALALVYPFSKRYTHFPQTVLGAAFAWAVPMAFAAQTNTLPASAWWLFTAAVIWAMAYDTFYAMADRDDDLKIGLKSTAILFGHLDLLMVGLFQATVIAILTYVGVQHGRGIIYFAGLAGAAAFVIFQLAIARQRNPQQCFKAFLNNNWLGMCVFIALFIDYQLVP